VAADALVFVGLGGLWFAFVLRSLASRSLVPVNDPRLKHPPVPAHGDGAHHGHTAPAGASAEVRHA
jgi:hypothetical protein